MRQALFAFVLVVAVAGIASPSFPSGFALIEQSVKGLGNAFAGGAAVCVDASTVFFNPAGMTRLTGHGFVASANIIVPSATFTNNGSTHALQPVTTLPLAGGIGGDAGSAEFAPNIFYSFAMENGIAFGVGVNAPFALSTEYDDDWVGRYHALASKLKTININPSIACRVGGKLSIGAGFSAQHMDVELSNAIDFGTLDAIGAFAPLPAGALGLTPQNSDGMVELEGNSWGFGFNAGVLVEFDADSRVGVSYRSRIRHEVDGTAGFTAPAALSVVQASTGFFTDSDVSASVDFPDHFSVSGFHRVNDRWAVMGDASWTHWSLFDELRFTFDNGQPDGVTTEAWEDSWRYSLGATFEPGNAWALRAGVAYDDTPIPDAQHRTPRIPTNERYWIAAGAGYVFSDRVNADVGYAHLFVPDPVIGKASLDIDEDLARGGLQGRYDASVDIFSVEVSVFF